MDNLEVHGEFSHEQLVSRYRELEEDRILNLLAIWSEPQRIAEFEALLKVSVDDFVRGRGLVLIFHSHRMLLGFIAREHDDLLRLAGAAFQETTYQSLPQGSGAARNQNSPAIKTMLLRIIPILHSWYHRLPNPLQAPATWDKSNRSLARICLLSCSDRRKNPRRE